MQFCKRISVEIVGLSPPTISEISGNHVWQSRAGRILNKAAVLLSNIMKNKMSPRDYLANCSLRRHYSLFFIPLAKSATVLSSHLHENVTEKLVESISNRVGDPCVDSQFFLSTLREYLHLSK